MQANKVIMTNRQVVSFADRGFSLVELSIVLVIVGLLVAGAMAGRALLRSAELRAVISEVENYKVQIDNFVTQYEGLPGDISNASAFWSGENNGDNNGRIGSVGTDNDEVFYAWRHLMLGRFIVGEYSGGTGDAVIGTNVPRSDYFANAGYSVVWDSAPGGWADALGRNFPGNVVVFATDVTSEDTLEGAVLAPEDAYSIDVKIDNEQPDYGKVLAENGDGVTGCTTGSAPNVEYDFSNVTVLCRMYFHLE